MITSKWTVRVIAILTAAAVAVCLGLMAFSDRLQEAAGGTGVTMEYESALFDTDSIMDLSISMDEDQFQEMLDTAIDETYYSCDVTVGGKTFYQVGIRAKGNTSLSSIYEDPDTDRYSFKLEFGHYIKGQTCFGLDKLVLNSNYADATNMKEAIAYDMFAYLGADASLYNYAKISVNGDYWGVYLALEAVEDSFLLRNYGTENGELYKPDTTEMNNMDNLNEAFGNETAETTEAAESAETSEAETQAAPDAQSAQTVPQAPDDAGNFGGDMGGGMTMGGSGADLNYTDDELSSYSTIWDSEVTKTGQKDHERVVTALKNAAEGNDLTTYLDVDNLLRYMAVHTFVVNLDSLSGSMAHNYYLYESGGQLNILPWDYNLSFGGFSMGAGSASSVVNYPIDTPFSGTDFFDSLLENETYLQQYHEYLRILCEEYVDGGGFAETYTRIRSQIDELVAEDPTAFYTEAEYEDACSMLEKTVSLRAQSIEGQLSGTIPSTTEGQSADSSALIDASEITISTMGTFGGGQGAQNAAQPEGMTMPTGGGTVPTGDGTAPTGDGTVPTGGGTVPTGDGTAPTGDAPTPPDGQTGTQQTGKQPEDFDPSQMGPGGQAGGQPGFQMGGNPPSMENGAPSMGQNAGGTAAGTENETGQTLLLLAAAAAVSALGLLFGFLYRRHPRRQAEKKGPKVHT